MSYLFFLVAALHAAGGVALGLAMAVSGDCRLGSIPAHLTWWVGFRWGYPHRPASPFQA